MKRIITIAILSATLSMQPAQAQRHSCYISPKNNICYCKGTEGADPMEYCEDDFNWGPILAIIGVAMVFHAATDGQYLYSEAPPDRDAIDFKFNVSPDETTFTLDIPINL